MRKTLLIVGALLFLAEEWLWTRTLRLYAWLDRHRWMRAIERRLAALPSAVALVVLAIPIVLLFPFKIFGLWLVGSGRFLTGCTVMLVAKLLSTAIVARIFIACRPQLLEMPWFARLYQWVLLARVRIHAWLVEQPTWRATKRWMRHLRSTIRGWRRNPRRGLLMRWRLLRRSQRRRAVAAH